MDGFVIFANFKQLILGLVKDNRGFVNHLDKGVEMAL